MFYIETMPEKTMKTCTHYPLTPESAAALTRLVYWWRM